MNKISRSIELNKSFYLCVRVCVCVYIYIYMYTHTHTHISALPAQRTRTPTHPLIHNTINITAGHQLLARHPWLQHYRNPHLPPAPGHLQASLFELSIAYAILLDPPRAARTLVLAPAPAPSPPPPAQGPSLSAAARALHARCEVLLPVRALATAMQMEHMCLEYVAHVILSDTRPPPLPAHTAGLLESIDAMTQQLLGHHLVTGVSTDSSAADEPRPPPPLDSVSHCAPVTSRSKQARFSATL